LAGIEPHIEVSVEVETEAAFGCIQLQRRNTEIEENTINWMKLVSLAYRLKVDEVIINQSNCFAVPAEPVLACFDGFRVGINA
jgi:hypothetical protein